MYSGSFKLFTMLVLLISVRHSVASTFELTYLQMSLAIKLDFVKGLG